jgi:hypothetical protein
MTIPANSEIITVTPDMFDMPYDAERTFPFFEDENGDGVYGYGHADKAEFAAKVNEYDAHCNGEPLDEGYTDANVAHTWAVAYRPTNDPDGDWRFTRAVADSDEGAFPMTVISR